MKPYRRHPHYPGHATLLFMLTLCLHLLSPSAVSAQTTDPLLEQARQALTANEVRSASIHLKNLLKKSPSDRSARTLLGQIYYAQKNYPGAAKELGIAVRLGSEDPDVLLMLAQAYLKQGEVQRIIDDIEPPAGASPQFAARVLSLRAQAMLTKGRMVKAEAEFEQALALDPESADATAGLARVALMRQQSEQALALAEHALERDPSNLQTWNIKGEALRKLQRFDEAAKTYDRLLELAPENVPGLTGRATLALREQHYEQAGNDIDQVLTLQENYIPALYLKSLLAYQRNELDDAASILDDILLRTRSHPPSHLLLGTIRYRQKQLEQAESHLALFIAKAPGHLTSRKLYAATLMKLGQPGRAVKILQPALAAHPDDPQLLALLGSARVQDGDQEDGTALLAKAVELNPDDAAFRTQLALSQLAGGDTEAAVGELETAVDLGLSQADFLLVLTYLKQKEFDKAIAAAQKLIEKLPGNPAPYNLIGAALAGKGDLAGSRAAFNKALAIDPDATASHFNLARIELRSGETEQAKQRLDDILSTHPEHIGSASTRAALALKDQDPAMAEQLLTRAFEANRKSLRAGLLLSNFHLRTKNPNAALAIAREVSTEHPKSAAAQRALAAAMAATGDHLGAVGALRNAVSAEPDSDAIRFQLALAQGRAGKYGDAKKTLQPLLVKTPDDFRVMVALAAIHVQLREYSQAMTLATRLQQARPENPIGYRLAGSASAPLTPEDALPYFKKAIELQPIAKHYALLYAVQARNGVNDEARATLKQWYASQPADIRPLLFLANDAERRHQADVALQYYGEIMRLDPDHAVALNNAAWLMLEKGDPLALDYARRAHDQAPDQRAITDTYGMVMVRLGDIKKGVGLLRKNASATPHKGEFSYHLTQGLYALGRRQEATRRLRRLLANDLSFAERAAAEQQLSEWIAAEGEQ